MLKKIGWGMMTLLAFLTLLIVSPYLTLDPEIFFPEQRATYLAKLTPLMIHIVGGMVALGLGPFLFLDRSRSRWIGVHRWLGRVYMLGILFGGLAGLYMAIYAYGGTLGRIGFATVALLWLITGSMAFTRIRQGNIHDHRRWMMRNFSLTLAAVMLRIQIPLLSISLDFDVVYPIVAWSSWLPNLLIAEWMIRRELTRGQRGNNPTDRGNLAYPSR